MILIETLYIAIFLGLYFSIFVLSTFFENRKEIYKGLKKENFPSVCLIVPCYNEGKNIKRTLDSLLNLDYPREKLEIIVVDDGSKDDTFLKAKAFEKRTKQVRVFRKENGGKYTALNYGLLKTKAQFIGSLDGDSYLDSKALKKVMKYFEDKKIMAVISTIKISEVKNIIEGIQYIEFLIAAFLRKVFSILDSLNVTPGPLSVFRREVYKILGPYRKAHQTEDLEFAFRLQKANFKIAHAIDSLVYTKACPTFKSLFHQRLRWRRGLLLNLKDYLELLNIKKHGNLSFLLYYSVIASFISIVLVGYIFWKIGFFFLEKINNFLLVGLDYFNLFSFQPDWILFNLGLIRPTLILGFLSLVAILTYIFLSKKLTFDKKSITKNTVFYLLLYVFLNAIWWISAFFFILVRKDISWQ